MGAAKTTQPAMTKVAMMGLNMRWGTSARPRALVARGAELQQNAAFSSLKHQIGALSVAYLIAHRPQLAAAPAQQLPSASVK